MMRIREAKKVIKAAEALEWGVTHKGKEFEFQKFSPAGQDFNISVIAGTLGELQAALRGM